MDMLYLKVFVVEYYIIVELFAIMVAMDTKPGRIYCTISEQFFFFFLLF